MLADTDIRYFNCNSKKNGSSLKSTGSTEECSSQLSEEDLICCKSSEENSITAALDTSGVMLVGPTQVAAESEKFRS